MIPVSKPSITDLEKKYVAKAMEEGMISNNGSFVKDFERSWAAINYMRYGISCNSGTNAIFLALKALGIGPGDEVIVPDFTMAATAWAVSYTGATPVFVDCDERLNIDVTKIFPTKKTKAIIPVHVYGRQCDMETIKVIAKEHHLYIVEDMAEAHGILPTGDIACYSFHANKIITTGEGGMCLTNVEFLAHEMSQLSTLYFDRNRTMNHERIGYNFKMTNVQAAIGLAQTERFFDILDKRDHIDKEYRNRLKDKYLPLDRSVLWMFDIQLDNMEKAKKRLYELGVDTRYFFKPMSTQPMYRGGPIGENALAASLSGIYLPTYTDMTDEEIKTVCDAVNSLDEE